MTEEVQIAGRTIIDLMLTPDIETLSEIVVIGYGEQKKINLTGSVSDFSRENLEFKDQLTEDIDNDGIPDAGNGVIDSNDRVIIGNRIPKYIYGGNIGLQYKGFDLGIIIQGVANRDVNTLGSGVRPIQWSDRGNLHQRWVDDAWSPENTGGTLPRLFQDTFTGLNDDISTFWVKDLSFFRLKNVQLGYNLPVSLINKYGMQKMRVYASVDNLLTPIGNSRSVSYRSIAEGTHDADTRRVRDVWDNMYRGVVRANDFLVHIDDIPSGSCKKNAKRTRPLISQDQ